MIKKIKTFLKTSDLNENIVAVAVAGSGFINFTLSDKYLKQVVYDILNDQNFGSSDIGKNKIWAIEHTSPNPNKSMHLGHLRNNVTGMAIANLWEQIGVKVIRDAVDNDRGIAIARLMWGYLKFGHKQGKTITDLEYWFKHQDEWFTPAEKNLRPDKFMDELYFLASQDFKNDPIVEQKIRQLVIDWEAHSETTWALWKKVMDYAHRGQDMTLKRLGNKWDKVWHEHEHYELGKELVLAGLAQGVFRKLDDGAILTDLQTYGLADTIVQKSDGTSLYITQDLALTKLKKQTHNADRLFWVVGPEQSLALKQMYAVCEQLGFAKLDDLIHIPYGFMSIKDQGKMSSRQGNVVYIDDLIDQAKAAVLQVMNRDNFTLKEIEELSELVAVGAVKYSILKVARTTDTAFDFKQSLRLDGNSGPYLQYTYARAKSVLAKAKVDLKTLEDKARLSAEIPLSIEANLVMRLIYRFPDVIQQAAEEYEPSLLATFLHELAKKYNSFYSKQQILVTDEKIKIFRLSLTLAVAKVMAKGLIILGIDAPERM